MSSEEQRREELLKAICNAFNNDEDVQSALKPFPNKTWKLKLSLVPKPMEEEKRLVVA